MQYQQLKRYCQNKHIDTGSKHPFCKDFATQCGTWRKEGDRFIVIMDANKHTMDGKLRKMLDTEGVGLVEFSHKYWGPIPPNTYINGTIPTDAGYS